MKTRTSDLLRHFLAGAVPVAAQYEETRDRRLKTRADDEREKNELALRTQIAEEAARDRKTREERAATTAAASLEDRAARRLREDEKRKYEQEHPFVGPHGNRFRTKDELKQFIRETEHVRGEERDEHRAPRQPRQPRDTGPQSRRSARGDAVRWYRKNAEKHGYDTRTGLSKLSPDHVAKLLQDAYPDLTSGEAYDIAISEHRRFTKPGGTRKRGSSSSAGGGL